MYKSEVANTTTETNHPSVPASSLHDILAMAETTLEMVDRFVPEIRMVSGLVPYGGAIVQGVTYLNPLLERIIMFAMAEEGKPFAEVLMDIVTHVTPGMQSKEIFGPNPPGILVDDPSRQGGG